MSRWSLTPSPPVWYCLFWLVMLAGWFLATRQAIISAAIYLRSH